MQLELNWAYANIIKDLTIKALKEGRGLKVINLGDLIQQTAKLLETHSYIKKAIEIAGEGNDVILTGKAPVWLYLLVAHALHGKAKRLVYRSPVTGDVLIFDHDPF